MITENSSRGFKDLCEKLSLGSESSVKTYLGLSLCEKWNLYYFRPLFKLTTIF